MCGIIGLLNQAEPVDAGIINGATSVLRSRGPDDFGVWVNGNIGLGHRRLSILDLSAAGHQPMLSHDGRYAIVFNGEIYNFKEIRKEFDENFPWRSQSDTEVILAAYDRWGTDCLKRMRGMFAFAIWDNQTRKLFAAVDRMGVKPFYFHHSQNLFAFSSRPRALLKLHSTISKQVDEQALRLFLEGGYIPAPYSIYKDVRKLPPAHYLLVDQNGLKIHRYWDFKQIEPDRAWEKRAESDLLDELDELLSQCVGLRMISDVPLGAFLSGGIDSSLVVALMTKQSKAPVKTFTIGFEDKEFDESHHAATVARHLGTEHYVEQLKVDSLLDLFPTFRDQYDEPFFDSSAFPTMAVSRLAHRHVTVSLSGDGGDELFGGYHYYQIANALDPIFMLPAAFRRNLSRLAKAIPMHRMKLLAGALEQTGPVESFAFARSIAKDYPSVISGPVLERTFGLPELYLSVAKQIPSTIGSAQRAMQIDASLTLPNDYLEKVDLGSMAFSLESRDPLLDHVLVEWAMRLPLKWKLRGRTNKYLLRQLAYRYIPREILDRPKQGFRVPIARWLRGPLKKWAESIIHDPGSFRDLPLEQKQIIDLFELHCSETRDVHPLLWAVLVVLDFNSQYSPQSSLVR